MNVLEQIWQYQQRIVRWFGRGARTDPDEIETVPSNDGSVDRRNEHQDSTGDEWYDASDLETRADLMSELGLTPAEFVTRLLEEKGGRLEQQAFSEYTAWSASTTSRILSDLEDDGEIARVTLGRENVVYLPDQAPARRPSTGDWPESSEA